MDEYLEKVKNKFNDVNFLVFMEWLDNEIPMNEYALPLFIKFYEKQKDLIDFHIKMTEPVFGKWNISKYI